MQKYTYKIVSFPVKGMQQKIDLEKVELEINRLGDIGWELVGTNELAAGGYTSKIIMIFKNLQLG